MAFDQTKDVLEHARSFHQSLSEFYEVLKSSTGEERARHLLEYMSRHEQYLVRSLDAYSEQVSDNVLDTYMQYESESSTINAIAEFEIREGMGIEEVIETAKHFDDSLIAYYREMAQRATSTKVREMFENLLAMEENEQFELSKRLLSARTA